MKLLIILAGILAVQAGVTKRSVAGYCQNGNYYEKHIMLKTGLDRPFLLAVDYVTDTLYFNYNVGLKYRSARLNLKTNVMRDIEGLPNGFAPVFDKESGIVYIGTSNGIYTYKYGTDKTELYGARGQNIWTLFYKDGSLYYTTFPSEVIYVISNGESMIFKELKDTRVKYFVIDDDNNMFFSNDTGLYKQNNDSDVAVLYKTFTRSWELRALTIDLNGQIYAGFQDKIVRMMKHEAKLEHVMSIFPLFGLTFDRDNNIIYSNSESLFRLLLDKDRNC